MELCRIPHQKELRDSAPVTYQDITPEKVEKALEQIDDALNGVDADKKMKAKGRRAIGHYLRGEYYRRLRRCRAAGQAGAAGARRWGEHQDHPAPGPHCGGGDSEEAGGEGMTNLRIGHGYDVHRLAAGRKLILGGVDIPYEKGLEGHSDADVLVHAVMDALLGAAGLEDIGCLFPDSCEEFRGISSLVLLERVAGELKKRSITVVNIDATILAQAPKLAPYRSTCLIAAA